MEHPTLIVALLLGLVEGFTEFLPISSTGHLIVAGSLLGYTGEQAKVFEVVIQAGAILAVCWEFRARLMAVARGLGRDARANRFVANLFIVPARGRWPCLQQADQVGVVCAGSGGLRLCRRAFVILWAERRSGCVRKPCASTMSTPCAGPTR